MWAALLLAAGALAWVQLTGIPAVARAWAVLLLVPLPALLILEGRKLRELEHLPRTQAYTSSIASLWLLAAATACVAWVSGYELADLGVVFSSTAVILTMSLALTLAGIGILFAFRFAGVREPDIVRQLLPASPADRVLFVGVSVSAGVCEEIMYRGFLLHALHAGTGSMALALVVSSGAFGVAHSYQQQAGALRAALLGLVLAVPVAVTGSIIPSIMAHTAIDLLSGLWLAKYLLR